MLKENSFSFSLDLKSGSDSISFSEFWRKLFRMEGPLNEILNLLLLSAVLGILQLNCEKFIGYPWQIFSKLSDNVKGAVLFLICFMKTATLKKFNLKMFNIFCDLQSSLVWSKRVLLLIIRTACFC